MTRAERNRRRRVYEETLASLRLDGLDLDEGTKALYRRYIDGDLTLAELGNEIDDRAKREFGARNPGRPSRC
jgi:hypothetical protein